MMLLLPLFFVIFIISFPAGLILYWITTNTWTIAQQWVMRRRIGPVAPVTPTGPPPSSGGRDGRHAAAANGFGGGGGGGGGLSGLPRKPEPEEKQPRGGRVERAPAPRGATTASATQKERSGRRR